MLVFSGTNYLGVGHSQSFRNLVEEGMDLYGLHYGGSRFSGLCPDIFNKAEKLLAEITGAESALIVSSGSKAGILATQLITQKNIIAAADTHPALLNTLAKVNFYHSLSSTVSDQSPRSPFTILCNALDPLYCKPMDFSFVETLNPEDLLIVDDSHGFGVTGNNGGGIYQFLRQRTAASLVVTGSLGKGFGIPGGLILSDNKTIDRIKSLPSFGGGAPPPPAFVYAFFKGQGYYEEARKKLQQNIDLFISKIVEPDDFNYLEDYPVFYTSKNGLAPYLAKNSIEISSFRYPTPTSDLITRVVLNSRYAQKEVLLLVDLINNKEAGGT